MVVLRISIFREVDRHGVVTQALVAAERSVAARIRAYPFAFLNDRTP